MLIRGFEKLLLNSTIYYSRKDLVVDITEGNRRIVWKLLLVDRLGGFLQSRFNFTPGWLNCLYFELALQDGPILAIVVSINAILVISFSKSVKFILSFTNSS